MKNIVLAIAALLPVAPLAWGSDLSIKGVSLGMSIEAYKTSRPDSSSNVVENSCIKGRCKIITVKRSYDQCEHDGPLSLCRFKESVAGIQNADLLTLFIDGKAAAVAAIFRGEEENMTKAAAALEAKYGSATSSADFQHDLRGLRWDIGGQSVTLTPRPCSNAFWMNTPSAALESVSAMASSAPVCGSGILYGNDIGMMLAFDAQLLDQAQRRMTEMDRTNTAKDLKDL